MSEPVDLGQQRASFADWLAVIAGTLGSMMAVLDTSILNSSLPTIQGEIGATASEGTWMGTSYLVAEVAIVPLIAWAQRVLGMRRLLLISASLFTLFSVICGMARNLDAMIIGRIGQGLMGGALIPLALTIIAVRLPPAQQGVGLTITAVASLLGPIGGPVIGGYLTENLTWHFAFFMNVPLCLCQIVLVAIAIPKEPGDLHEFRNADWMGIFGMVIGLGAVTTMLEEGHRELWFESGLIRELAAAGAIGCGMIVCGQLRARRPVLRLGLLLNPALASAIGLLSALGCVMYTSLFVTPQFLAAVAGYNAFQAGQVALITGAVSVTTAFLYPTLAKHMDMRVVVAFAILCMATAAFLASDLTVQSVGSHFTPSQILYGLGSTLTAIPLQGAVIAAVSAADAPEANSMSAVARNLGGSLGLAAIAAFQDQRLDVHHWQLGEALSANSLEVQQQLADGMKALGGGPEGLEAAYRALDGQVVMQALVMTFSDEYLALATLALCVAPLAYFLAKKGLSSTSTAVH